MQKNIDPEGPYEVPEVQKSTRVKFQRRQIDVPRTVGSKYAVAVEYLEDHGELHLDAHMFFNTKIQWEQPDVITVIMKQLLITAGFKK